MIDLQKY